MQIAYKGSICNTKMSIICNNRVDAGISFNRRRESEGAVAPYLLWNTHIYWHPLWTQWQNAARDVILCLCNDIKDL